MPGAAVERLNAPAWDGDAPFYEDWYAKANVPEEDASVWVRYTLRAPHGSPAEATVWAIVDRAGEKDAGKARVGTDELALEGAPFRFETPHGDLGSTACGGDLGSIRWEMSWEPTPYAFWELPGWAYELPDVFSKTVTPNPDLAMHGRVDVGGTELGLEGAPGQQGHVWGLKHADAWAWAHANAGDGPVWAAVAARKAVGRLGAPTVATVLLRHEGETLAFRNPLVNRASFGTDGLEFQATSLKHRVRGHVEPADLARIAYTDPDGETAWCHNTKRATGELVLERRGLTGWREVGRWREEGVTAFEVGLREPDPHVPALL